MTVAHQQSGDLFPNLDHLVRNGGSYLVGDTRAIMGVAIASDPQIVYAALIRKACESLDQLHARLDDVVGQVMREEIEPGNEVPGGNSMRGMSEAIRAAVSDGGM